MYHYGLTIKEYREAKGLTQAQLSEIWPKSNGEIGVKPDYVSLVENGKRPISDINVLRGLCDVLDIPLWKMGLSEYNPFKPDSLPGKGRYLYDETLDTVEDLITNAWILRRTSNFTSVTRNVVRLDGLFAYLNANASKPSKLEYRFNSLYCQVLNLKAMIYVEEVNDAMSYQSLQSMLEIAEAINDPVSLSRAYLGIGMCYARKGDTKASVMYLERARDYTFETSRHLSGLVLSFLARAYAKDGRRYDFERAVNTSLRIASMLGSEYGDGTDYAVHSVSDILEEKSNGYIELGLGKETLAMRGEIEASIKEDNNYYLDAWLPLDYAQAYMLTGEVEASIKELEDFKRRMITQLHSPMVYPKMQRHIIQLEERGYKDVGIIKILKESIADKTDKTCL